MLGCNCFPAVEDRATLRSNPSAAAGSRRQCMMRCLFTLPSRKHKALNLGVRGRAPGAPVFREARLQRVYASLTVTVILPRGELFQIPLVAIIVVVIHPVGNNSLNLLVGVTLGDQGSNLILHMTEEALLWRVIPAIALPGHRLDKGSILELLDKGVAGIMAALIAVDNSCVIQFGSIFAAHDVNHVENKIDSKIVTEPVGQYFVCTNIQDWRQITNSASVKEVGNVCQQSFTGHIAAELSVNLAI